ncbi:MAG: DnaB-like helicase C-terminal domain-containing protein, partial [Candidatus Omnitrophica bacterium]|nr:DnaB-like helicase C-terminal domain-containing protein [Candidatus Omnitrophota bacterium]
QLMRSKIKEENRQQEISEISRSLKALARELHIPVVAISQLSRAVEARADHRPQLSDLRESGAIEQDADLVILLLREEYYNPTEENEGIAEVIIAKQRNGPVGSIKLTFIKEYTRFENLALRE